MTQMRKKLSDRIEFIRHMAPCIGVGAALKLQIAGVWNKWIGGSFPSLRVCELHVHPRGYRPVAMRLAASDLRVFEQIFVWQHYLPVVSRIHEPRVIVDCGANVGYSTLFFLSHFPRARVIAVEPDPENAELCRRNLSAYGDRVVVLQKALWGSVAKLSFAEETRKVGEEWGIQVRPGELKSSGGIVDAIDVVTLMKEANVAYIDLLKIDIEKSETDVFQRSSSQWLSKIGNIAIELHGEDCATAFRTAMSQYSFTEQEQGEVVFCLGIGPLTQQVGNAMRR